MSKTLEPTESAIVFDADGRVSVHMPDGGHRANDGTNSLLRCLRYIGVAKSAQWARDAAQAVEAHQRGAGHATAHEP